MGQPVRLYPRFIIFLFHQHPTNIPVPASVWNPASPSSSSKSRRKSSHHREHRESYLNVFKSILKNGCNPLSVNFRSWFHKPNYYHKMLWHYAIYRIGWRYPTDRYHAQQTTFIHCKWMRTLYQCEPYIFFFIYIISVRGTVMRMHEIYTVLHFHRCMRWEEWDRVRKIDRERRKSWHSRGTPLVWTWIKKI